MPGGRVADGRVCDCGCSSCDRNECAEQEVERAARSAGEWTREHAGDVGKDFRRADVQAFARSGGSSVDAARADSDRARSRGREDGDGRLGESGDRAPSTSAWSQCSRSQTLVHCGRRAQEPRLHVTSRPRRSRSADVLRRRGRASPIAEIARENTLLQPSARPKHWRARRSRT